MSVCTNSSILKVIYFLKIIVIIIKIAVPIILVALSMIDLFKAVIASDDKEKKKAVKLLIKRVIYSLLIFFVPTIVNTLMITIGNMGESENFTDCLENATIENINKYQAEEEKKKQEEAKKNQSNSNGGLGGSGSSGGSGGSSGGTGSGTYTSKICGGKYTAKKLSNGQCAEGVYAYFKSFLPSADPTAWKKFDSIAGHAKDYYFINDGLGSAGFKMDKNVNNLTPGTLIVYFWLKSDTKCDIKYGSADRNLCGHIQVVEANDGKGNLTIFECNTSLYSKYGCGEKKCCTHPEKVDYYRRLFKNSDYEVLGFIHVLKDCNKKTTSVINDRTNTTIN